MPCKECERLSRCEIEATRQIAAAQDRLQAYSPEPPFGESAARELNSIQQAIEELRATIDRARSERIAHSRTHALTISN